MTAYVLAVPLSNGRGAAAPLDLLRKVANIAGRAAVQKRLDRAFADYLVTDPVELPLWRRLDGRPVLIVATDMRCYGLHGMGRYESIAAGEVGAIDAPEFVPAGSVVAESVGDFERCCVASLVMRRGAS